MANRTLTLRAATIGLTTALSLAAVTAGDAEPRWGGGAAIGAGLAGAAIAATPNYGYYDYAPGAVAPMADSYDAFGQAYSWRHPGDCRFSIYNC
jgi:hypothetical protein